MKLRYAVLLALVVLTCAFAAVFFFKKPHASVGAPSEERSQVLGLFEQGTPKEAYTAFVKMNSLGDERQQHLNAHIFGEELYSREGMNGFPVCGPDFGYGCYHGFIGALITAQGIQAVGKLDAACIKAYGPLALGCFHGLGHGLVSYYGYGEKDLNNALSVCATLSWKGLYGGCADGAFMEYNLRTMQADTGGQNRPFSSENPFAPCPSVESRFRASCYFGEAEWWRQSFTGDADAAMRIATYCTKLSTADDRSACFRGLGYAYSPFLDFDAGKGSAFCATLASVPGARIGCAEGYAWSLYANGKEKEAESVCTHRLPEADSAKCLKEYLFVLQ